MIGHRTRIRLVMLFLCRLTESIDDASFIHIVGRHLQLHPIAGRQADKAFAHLARDMRENEMLVREFHAKHRAGQHGDDLAFQLDRFDYCHV